MTYYIQKIIASTETEKEDDIFGFEGETFRESQSAPAPTTSDPRQTERPHLSPARKRDRFCSYSTNDSIGSERVEAVKRALLNPASGMIVITHIPNDTHGYVSAERKETCIGMLKLGTHYPVTTKGNAHSISIGQKPPSSQPYQRCYMHWKSNSPDPTIQPCNMNELVEAIESIIKEGRKLPETFKKRCNELGNLIIKMHLNVTFANFLDYLHENTGFELRQRSNTAEKQRMTEVMTLHRTKFKGLTPTTEKGVTRAHKMMEKDPAEYTNVTTLPPSDLHHLFQGCKDMPLSRLTKFLRSYAKQMTIRHQGSIENLAIQTLLAQNKGAIVPTGSLIKGSAFLRQQLSRAIVNDTDLLQAFKSVSKQECETEEAVTDVLLEMASDKRSLAQLQKFFGALSHIDSVDLSTAIYFAVLKEQTTVANRDQRPIDTLYLNFYDDLLCKMDLSRKDDLLDDIDFEDFRQKHEDTDPLDEFNIQHFEACTQLAVYSGLQRERLEKDLSLMEDQTVLFKQPSLRSTQLLNHFSEFICRPDCQRLLFWDKTGVTKSMDMVMKFLDEPPAFLAEGIHHQTAIDIERWIPSLSDHQSHLPRADKICYHICQIGRYVGEDIAPDTLLQNLPSDTPSGDDWERFLEFLTATYPKTAQFCRRMNQSQANLMNNCVVLPFFNETFTQLTKEGLLEAKVMPTLNNLSRKITVSVDPSSGIITITNSFEIEAAIFDTRGDASKKLLATVSFTTSYDPSDTHPSQPGSHGTTRFSSQVTYDTVLDELLPPAPKKLLWQAADPPARALFLEGSHKLFDSVRLPLQRR